MARDRPPGNAHGRGVGSGGGPIHLVQVTRHRQLLEQYMEYLGVAQRLREELLDTIDQLREIHAVGNGPGGGRGGGGENGVGEAYWDERTVRGARAWADDVGVSWRALRRARFRQDKASELLLTALTARTTHCLHTALPPHLDAYIRAGPSPPIYTILPPQWYTDRIGRPTGVLTLRHIKRDIPCATMTGETGKDGIREFAWWIAELTRRCMRDWYRGESSPDGSGGGGAGGGCVLLVDAKDAGIKNLELELLPNLISINHNNFPSQFSTVYVVNHSWTHSGLWACIKRVLPQSALEKIVFLKGEQELADVFDPERLPKAYGGKSNRDLHQDASWLYEKYGRTALDRGYSPAEAPTEAEIPLINVPSYESIADVFYSARNTPMPSAQVSPVIRSRRGSGKQRPPRLNLAMTPRPGPAGLSFVPLKGTQQPSEATGSEPVARVKSISEFQLYLSPSRVNNLDLLLGSDEEASDEEALQLESLRARQRARRESRSSLRSSVVVGGGRVSSSTSRRSLASVTTIRTADIATGGHVHRPAITPWVSGSGRAADSMRQASWDDARSYSASLTRHHAEVLTKNTRPSAEREALVDAAAAAAAEPSTADYPADDADSPTIDHADANDGDTRPLAAATVSTSYDDPAPRRRIELPISAYDRMMNPMFGYPVMRTVSTSGVNLAGMLRPRYGRKRKRDLVKTLLFLFLLRLDTLRRWIGQATTNFVASIVAALGLGGWFGPRRSAHRWSAGAATHGRRNPEQAFAIDRQSYGYPNQAIGKGSLGELGSARGDWLWMIITIILVRGSWGRLLLSALEELRRIRRIFTITGR
ncbi:hypothetical protein NliqN6_2138 [Naganishia liquefaciens]|uniref:CRAL-TRIO domain-containing protein n=1 Tax=Naganishia liquefaciens TaxID=104408 RepID=A0A8H3YFI8_9TREE|nr:hypothetical protein NliqN6_2138 [Naganishia liquefaciens]